ncbi:MAG: acylphosphatase [Cyclobacteriaceae bacterium]|jgi:acylphosphatase
MNAIQINCRGKVQVVFFRVSTKKKADELGVFGWVRNEQDGSVTIHAEGDADDVRKLLIWCETGPQFAKVTKVTHISISLEGFKSFEIKHS